MTDTALATLTVGSLFTGIGGLDLGLERAGMRVVWQSEIDPYACRVLAKHWPDVPNLGSVKDIDWSSVERPDLICGGYPCQPFSFAGTRQGEDDPRHLWPYFARALRVLRPRWALLENVPGHLSLGFGTVHADLAELGYDTEWESVPASAFSAPHLRWRIFVVAHARRGSGESLGGSGQLAATAGRASGEASERERLRDASGGRCTALADPESHKRRLGDGDGQEDVPDTHGGRLEERREPDSKSRLGGEPPRRHDAGRRGSSVADTASEGRPDVFGSATLTELAGRRTAGSAGWWDVEPDVGRVADGVPSRVDRLRGLGNAVVPQVAEWIGRQIVRPGGQREERT